MLVQLVIALLFFAFSSAQNDSCMDLSTCGKCIQEPSCIWCLNPTNNTMNCQNKENSSCETQVSANISSTIIRNDPLSSDQRQQYVQIQPQHIKLKIPKNQAHTVEFKFARAQNPLDLYFLMDASYTMKPYKDLISKLGNDLVEAITKQTSDYKIGFGSFVDKTLPPIDFFPGIAPNCGSQSCIRGYSFKNHLSLTTNIEEFQTKVNETEISSNLDHPEGGLEALIQVLVCTNEIGWRKEATRLVVFTTDDYFHVAGDGRLVGALHPNDGQCHTINNEYTKDHEFDYPSISFVNHKSLENGIHIIFAIAESEDARVIQEQYKELKKHIDLSKYHKLTNKSEEIINLVVGTYKVRI
nr:integrin beta-1-like [Onthophagus taurus]